MSNNSFETDILFFKLVNFKVAREIERKGKLSFSLSKSDKRLRKDFSTSITATTTTSDKGKKTVPK